MEPFAQLVFSGGGIRCFWYGGFLEAVREPLQLEPERVSGVSGGALSAACFIADRGQALLENMGNAFEDLDRNVRFDDDDPGSGLTPHQQVYRDVVEKTINAEAEAKVAEGPQFQVLLGHPPSRLFPRASTIPLFAAYVLDLQLRSTPHLKFTDWGGLSSELIDAREAARDGLLVDLICNAAVIPPVFNLQGWKGRKVVDGGLISKAPMPQPDRGRTLVLLTRRYRNLPREKRRVFAQVSDETPADKLDFTDREELEQTWEMGREDGAKFLAEQAAA